VTSDRQESASGAAAPSAVAGQPGAVVAEVAKKWTFDAAHHLPDHDGKCRNEHGHTYTVEVSVWGVVQPTRGRSDDGMVLDFGDLSRVWKSAIEPLLDHRDLNETVGARGCWPTTAENLAHWIGESFIDSGVEVAAVSVWETPTSRVTARWGPGRDVG